MIIIFGTLAGLLGLGAAATVVGRLVYERRMASEIDALLDAARPAASTSVSERDLERLPEAVRRWLRYSQVVGTQRPTTVRLRQHGEFQMDSRGWLPYEAEQYFTTDPPAFLWKASFRMLPLVSVAGRDQYRNGEASLQMRILSLSSRAKDRRRAQPRRSPPLPGRVPMVSRCSPGRLRHLGGIRGGPARATISHGGVTASMTFVFGADGRLLKSRRSVTTMPAAGTNGGSIEMTPTRCSMAFASRRRRSRWEYDSGSIRTFAGISPT